MLGKKQTKIEEKIDLEVVTIPKEFYAGANPVVKFKEVEDIVELPKKQPELTAGEKEALDKVNAAGGSVPTHPANILTSRKFIFIGGLILFLLASGGGAVYYFVFQKKANTNENPPVVSLTQNNVPTSTVNEITPTSTIETNTTTEPTGNQLPIDFPSTLLGVSSDYDNDNISDVAETYFNTDPTDSDTDKDKYPDGHELYYLYNPSGFEPMRLIDSGLVTDYKNPKFGYRVYTPNEWVVGIADSEYKEVLFSAINGEYIMVRVFDFGNNETFSDWFAEYAPEERIAYLADFTTSFNLSGKKRNDGLVYYFMDEKNIYVITYHPTDEAVINYKIVMDVMARSFRLPDAEEQTTVSEEAPGFVENETQTNVVSSSVEQNVATSTEETMPIVTEEATSENEENLDTEESLVI